VTLAIYIKDDQNLEEIVNRTKKRDRIFSAAISTVGLISIAFAAWPIIAWQIFTVPFISSAIKNIPIPKGQVLSAQSTIFQNVQVAKDSDGFTYFTTNYKPNGYRPKEFTVSIPKLKISSAKTVVDNLDFYNNLSHFPGSALPGEVGNVFITGHSVLPQFTDTSNYQTIFSKLSDLEIGDVINVDSEGKNYQYIVQYKKIVDPHDLSVLGTISKNAKNLTLMTCVPPGTSLKRMVVITSLI